MSATTPSTPSALRIIAIGAATGALAGAGAVAVYALLLGKGLAVAGMAKAGAGLASGAGSPSAPALGRVFDLLLPGAVGAAGGGAAGAGFAQRQVKRALAPLRAEVGDLARQVVQIVGEPGHIPKQQNDIGDDAAPGDGRPKVADTPSAPAPDGARRREIKALQRIRGIGPRFAQLLADGGIDSLARLAAAEPDALRRLLAGSSAAPTAEPEDWIAEARALAAAAGGVS